MTYFRTNTEFLSSSLTDNDISDRLVEWRGWTTIQPLHSSSMSEYHDFTGPGVDVTKLLKVFQEILWLGAGLVGCSNRCKYEQ